MAFDGDSNEVMVGFNRLYKTALFLGLIDTSRCFIRAQITVIPGIIARQLCHISTCERELDMCE